MSQVEEVLGQAIDRGVFPGCAYAYGLRGQGRTGWMGRESWSERADSIKEDSLWDLASLTKITATTPVAMTLAGEGLLDLDAPAGFWLPEAGCREASVRSLLLHRSGLPAYESFHLSCRSRDEAERLLLSFAPHGHETVYSCLGFMILQRILERTGGAGLDALAAARLFRPLGMTETRYLPGPKEKPRCVPTEQVPEWRKTPGEEAFLRGEVHDPAAWFFGGISGNAGLFSTIGDMNAYAQELASCGGKALPPRLLETWRRRQNPDATRGLGFDTKGEEPSRGGPQWPASSFGHTGYTGTSLWVDPESGLYAVLLTNRVHPDDGPKDITGARTAFGQAVWKAVRG